MNLLIELKKASANASVVKIATYVGNNKTRYSLLISVFLTSNYRINQRSTLPLLHIHKYYPELILPYLRKMIALLKKTDTPDATRRNMLRLLQFITIPQSLQGTLAAVCFNFLKTRKEPVAIRVFSMTILANIAAHHPSLKEELRIILEDELPYGGPGIRSRAKKVLTMLRSI